MTGLSLPDEAGHFMLILQRATLPRFASDNRMSGTAEENKAVGQAAQDLGKDSSSGFYFCVPRCGGSRTINAYGSDVYGGGRYWTRTSDLVRVKQSQRWTAMDCTRLSSGIVDLPGPARTRLALTTAPKPPPRSTICLRSCSIGSTRARPNEQVAEAIGAHQEMTRTASR